MAKNKIQFYKWKTNLEFISRANSYFHDGVLWGGRTGNQHGRSTASVTCPCCDNKMEVYIWSFCGGGKRCASCKVLLVPQGVIVPKNEVPTEWSYLINEKILTEK